MLPSSASVADPPAWAELKADNGTVTVQAPAPMAWEYPAAVISILALQVAAPLEADPPLAEICPGAPPVKPATPAATAAPAACNCTATDSTAWPAATA